ncbi:serine/threonine protein kinase [Myxococcus xanthus]|uniref:Serine/threonine protein kinase n=1 Tax=Myxococcus xanthus TaxID=34 RepID=A0A7Y4IK45_MYXXA|nr:serine/threonine-protein kinase [Myxococcus xanthus]NOJ80586.1 serine/threonine protein kinase [Myxococcus xanthus]NOJ87638.1 serine/threonine protein kinase [Myxococcus xanthus]
MARPVEPAPLEGPVRFGPYTLVRRIGAGGMGEVFLAREEAPRRACVVKKVLPQLMASPQFAGRFRDEARVVVRLHHPNIARVYAMGEVEGQLYLSMEYVQGKTLSRLTYRLRQLGRTLPLGIMLHLGQRLCEGLAYAHDATDEFGNPLHLVHRDLSPANVCISYAGEVKIIDFGAAQSTLKEQQTAPRVVIGNLTYMAPEQARKRFVDRRADVYAVGALLWELFAWKPLAQRGDPVERWRRAAYPQWEPAGSVRQGVPTSVDAFLMRALASEPDHRFPDAAAMGAELERMKAKLAPNVGDADVARLIAAAFPREKKAEELVLRELLREPRSRALTEPALAAVLAPPTALAFEHEGIDAPEDYVPAERGDAEPSKAPPSAHQSDANVPAAPDASGRGTPAKAAPAAHADADELEVTVRGTPGKAPESPRVENAPRVTALYGTEDEATVVEGGASRARRGLPGRERAHLDVEGEATVVHPSRGPAASAPLGADEEPTVVQPERARMAAAAGVASKSEVGPGAANAGANLGGDAAATEAVDAAKLMVALERAEAIRSQGARAAASEDVTVTEVNPARALQSLPPQAAQLRRATRETQVGFGVDISQAVDAAAVEARRLELVRAITGDDALPMPEPEEDSGTWLRGGRPWLVAGLCAGACALGLALAWALA